MEEKDKESLIRTTPIIILIVAVGTATHYNLLYVIPAGAIGGLIGHFILKFYKKRKNANHNKSKK
ncbi:MAG: hypothetical protein AABX83_01335 [Nanoarchaeota archaeon]